MNGEQATATTPKQSRCPLHTCPWCGCYTSDCAEYQGSYEPVQESGHTVDHWVCNVCGHGFPTPRKKERTNAKAR